MSDEVIQTTEEKAKALWEVQNSGMMTGRANLRATLAASKAFEEVRAKAQSENREVTPEEMAECERIGLAAVIPEAQEQPTQENDQDLRHAYFTAICNSVQCRVKTFQEVRESAATLDVPTVSFGEWKNRLGI